VKLGTFGLLEPANSSSEAAKSRFWAAKAQIWAEIHPFLGSAGGFENPILLETLHLGSPRSWR
jgi:hypothetical protein